MIDINQQRSRLYQGILLLNEEQGTREQLPGTPESLLTRHTVTDAHANSFQMYAEDGNACGEAWRRRILAECKKIFFTDNGEEESAAWLSTQPPEFLIDFGGLSSEVSWPRTSPLYSTVPRFVVHGESSLTFREARLPSSRTVIRLLPSFLSSPSPSFSRQKRFEFGGQTAVDKGRARYSLIFFVKVSKRTKMYGHSFIKHFVVRILFEKMIVIGWIQISVWRILEIKILFALTRGEILERIQHSYHGAAYSHPLRRKFCPCWDNTTREKTRDACSYRSNTSPLSIQILRKIGNKGYNVTNDNFLKKISLKKRCFDPIVKSTRTILD